MRYISLINMYSYVEKNSAMHTCESNQEHRHFRLSEASRSRHRRRESPTECRHTPTTLPPRCGRSPAHSCVPAVVIFVAPSVALDTSSRRVNRHPPRHCLSPGRPPPRNPRRHAAADPSRNAGTTSPMVQCLPKKKSTWRSESECDGLGGGRSCLGVRAARGADSRAPLRA